jgi:hypothetical protein
VLDPLMGPETEIAPGSDAILRWRVPATDGRPIYEIGVELEGEGPLAVSGTAYLDYIRWKGAPDIVLRRPDAPGVMWTHAFVNDASHFQTRWEAFRVSHEEGLGTINQGTRDWLDYEVSSTLRPALAKRWGLGAHVQGRRRWLALMFDQAIPGGGGTRATLVRCDGEETILGECRFAWRLDQRYDVRLSLKGSSIEAFVDGKLILTAEDAGPQALDCGGIALLVDTGSLGTEAIKVSPCA